jgi:hypothetical protein
MTTKQALAELKKLAKEAGRSLYRRLELAAVVLQDLDWIAQVHGGSDLKAQDALEDEFFRDVGGYVTLGKLLAMYRHVPKAKWVELRYKVQAIELEYDEQAAPDKRETGVRTAWKQIAEERGDKLEAAERKILILQAKVDGLTSENERLKGRIEQLEKMLERKPVGV